MYVCSGGDHARLRAASVGLERAAHGALHHAICDACGGLILGRRYRCADCDDFDLCRACLAAAPSHAATAASGSSGSAPARASPEPESLTAAASGTGHHQAHHRVMELARAGDTSGRWAEHGVFAAELAHQRRAALVPIRFVKCQTRGISAQRLCKGVQVFV